MTVYKETLVTKGMILDLQTINAHSSQKQSDTYDEFFKRKHSLKKIFEGEMLIRTLPITLLQIFCEITFNSRIIVDPDNNIYRN